MITIYDIECPKCRNICYYCDYFDPNDLSGMDIECLKCWNCENVFGIDERVEDFNCPEKTYKTAKLALN